MFGPISIASRSPRNCSEEELGDFRALVLAGGEVIPGGLEARIRAAHALVFLTVGCCLCGVAAIKQPETS